MWYNQAEQTRGYTVTFPDGLRIAAADADKSPVRGWEWHDEPPQWWQDLNNEDDGTDT